MTVYLKGNTKYLSGHDVPQVSDLFIDKLCMTLHFPITLHKQIVDKFDEADNIGVGVKYKNGLGGYKFALKLSTDLPNEGDIIIQCSPNHPKKRFFRIEFNPAKTDLGNLKKDLDNILPGGYDHLIEAGKVNRIDFTVDASYLDATDVLAKHKKMKTEKHYAKNGSIESKYLGASSSTKQFLLYDKVQEIKEKNKKKPSWQKAEVPTTKLFRIECKLMKLECPLKEIVSLANPFSELTLTAYPDSKSTKNYDPLWTLFLSACRFEGIESALAYLSEEDKAEFAKRLKVKGKTDWWNPEKVWQGLASAINIITNVKSYAPPLTKLA